MDSKKVLHQLFGLVVVMLLLGYGEMSTGQTTTSEPPSPAISTVTETDTSDSPNYATLVVVNNSSLPVVTVNLKIGESEENKLSSPIPVGDSVTITNISPTDDNIISSGIAIIKSNDTADTWKMSLKAGKTYTYTIRDSKDELAVLTVINKTAAPITTSSHPSPIPSGGQATTEKVQPGDMFLLQIVRSDETGFVVILKINAGETCTYIMEE